MTNCPKCGKKLFNNKGIGKNGFPYENFKCPDKACGFIEWVEQENRPSTIPAKRNYAKGGGNYAKPTQTTYKSASQEPNWDVINKKKEENISFLNARNVAGVLLAAAIKSGELKFQDALDKYAEVVQKIYDIDKGQLGENDFQS